MAPVEGRVAKPERRLGFRRGTPRSYKAIATLTVMTICD